MLKKVDITRFLFSFVLFLSSINKAVVDLRRVFVVCDDWLKFFWINRLLAFGIILAFYIFG